MVSWMSVCLSAIVAISGYIGSRLVARNALELAHLAQISENLRLDAKLRHETNMTRATRLRELYAPFIDLQLSLQTAVMFRGYTEFGNPLPPDVVKELDALRDKCEVAESVRARLFLEPDAQEQRLLIESVITSANNFFAWFSKSLSREERDFRAIREDRKIFDLAVEDATRSMREQLRNLETPDPTAEIGISKQRITGQPANGQSWIRKFRDAPEISECRKRRT